MKAGKLDRRIRLEILTAGTQSASGQISKTPLLLCEVWAEKFDETGREFWRAKQTVAEVTACWRIRWSSVVAEITPTEDFQIVDAAGRVFDVLSVSEEGRREALLVFGKARAE